METNEITQAIKEARPKLSVISPLVSKIIVGFIVMNILLGVSLITKFGFIVNGLVIAPNEFIFQLWGAVFVLLGITKLIAYRKNNWPLIRHILVVAVFIKLIWAIALVIRYVSGDFSNPFLLIVWLFITHVQAATYVHFMPIPQIQKGAEDADK